MKDGSWMIWCLSCIDVRACDEPCPDSFGSSGFNFGILIRYTERIELKGRLAFGLAVLHIGEQLNQIVSLNTEFHCPHQLCLGITTPFGKYAEVWTEHRAFYGFMRNICNYFLDGRCSQGGLNSQKGHCCPDPLGGVTPLSLPLL